MSKKILIASILIMTMIFSFATMSYAAGDPTVTIGNISGKAGETATVELTITNNPGFIIMYLGVDYDEDVMMLKSIEFTNDSVKNQDNNITNTPHVVLLGNFVAESDIKDNGSVAKLTFELKQDVESTDADVQPELYDFEGNIFNYNGDQLTFAFKQAAPAGGETFETWVGGTRYENNKFLAIVKYSGNATEYGIRFNDFDFVAKQANEDNIFAIEVEDVAEDPTNSFTAFAR